MFYNQVTGIFWDYENVPLRNKDWNEFAMGLKNYINSTNVKYFKVYFRRNSPISEDDIEILDRLPLLQFKEIDRDDPNAADNSLIRSCQSVLNNLEEINHVILITGDADFIELTDLLNAWAVQITIICQSHNYSQNLINEGHRAYTVDFIAQNQMNWWF